MRLRSARARDRLPEIGNLVGAAALDLDDGGVALGAIADDAFAARHSAAGEIDTHRNAVAHHRFGAIDQTLARMQRAQRFARRAQRRRGESGFATAASLRAPAPERSLD